MNPEALTIARAELTANASRVLIEALNAELSRVYPEPGANHFRLDAEEVGDGRGAFLVVYQEGTPVGCGALRLLDAGTAELKRMYVDPALRGQGLGRRLVAALEAEAEAMGVRRLVLETGVRQAAALALYRRAGFHPIPLYGEYRLSPQTSVCLGKELDLDSSIPEQETQPRGGLADPVDALILDLLESLALHPRPYSEMIDAWRTSCPRLPVWEEATDRGFIERRGDAGGVPLVCLTRVGREFLARHRGEGRVPGSR